LVVWPLVVEQVDQSVDTLSAEDVSSSSGHVVLAVVASQLFSEKKRFIRIMAKEEASQ